MYFASQTYQSPMGKGVQDAQLGTTEKQSKL